MHSPALLASILDGEQPSARRQLATVHPEAVARLADALAHEGVGLDGRLLRVAVLAAATWDKPKADHLVLGEQLGRITAQHARGEARIPSGWRVLRDVDMDEPALAALTKLAAQFRTYGTAKITVTELWGATGDTPASEAILMRAYDVAESQRTSR